MAEYQIRRLPVVKNDRIVGIITRGDIRGAEASEATLLSVWELNYLLSKLKIKRIMTPHPIVISQEATIDEAAQMMLEIKISGLPVVDYHGKLVGIITESDIFRVVVREWRKASQENAVPILQ
jgi:acetoin utilization protein AcuB